MEAGQGISKVYRSHASRRTRLAAILVGALAVPLLGGISSAEETTTEPAAFQLLPETLEVIPDRWVGSNHAHSSPMIFWTEGRRAYQFAATPGAAGADLVVPVDLDTLRTLTRVVDGEERRVQSPVLDPALSPATSSHLLQPEQIALDPERGVMFLPHRTNDPTCKAGGQPSAGCLGGIHVLDLTDDALTPLPMDGHDGRIRFVPLGVDGVVQSPVLRAMTHSDLGGAHGKLHLLVQEQGHYLGAADGGTSPRNLRVPHWIVQIDVATGRHDWVATAPGCTSWREGTGTSESVNRAMETSHAAFVADHGGTPVVYVGCYGPSNVGSVGRLHLDPVSLQPLESGSFPGPANVASIQADPASRRVWFQSLAGGATTWWVFDGGVDTYLGVVGVGGKRGGQGAIDPATGRLYFLSHEGMFVTDGRRVPVAQALWFDDLPLDDILRRTRRLPDGSVDYQRDADGNPADSFHIGFNHPPLVDPAADGRPRRLFVRPGTTANSERWYVIADRQAVADTIFSPEAILQNGLEDPPSTADIELSDDLTRTTFTGSARAYGLRTILLGGTDAALFPTGGSANTYYRQGLLGDQPANHFECGRRSREFAFGLSGSAETAGQPAAGLQPASSSGAAIPAVTDRQTRQDLAHPSGDCGATPLLSLLEQQGIDRDTMRDLLTSLGVRDPVDGLPGSGADGDVPGYDGEVFERQVGCSAPDFDEDGTARTSTKDSSGDASIVGPVFAAQVDCDRDQAATGSSQARFVSAGPVTVSEAASTYDVMQDAETGGLFARAHAYARGISVVHDVIGPSGDVVGTSTATVDMVETEAEAWATGRTSTEDEEGCEAVDRSRGAGTCIRTTIAGVRVVDGVTGQVFECEQCQSDEQQQQMVTAMRQALGGSWQVLLREPDAALARGTSNGTLAAVQKREIDEFADVVMKGDLIKTLPGLELIRYNDNVHGRGRQVYQFAGVELGAVFTRQCLGILESNQCAQPPVPLAQVGVSLADAVDGTPLAGGEFSLNLDSPFPGATPLEGPTACTTDSQGRCELLGLPAGGYTLTQTLAPGDYTPAGSLTLNLFPGSRFDVEVTNVRQIGAVEVRLTDLDDGPLPGGVFELYTDADSDGTIGLDDTQAAVCTTGPGGTCTMTEVPLGAYMLRQAAAPAGFVLAEDQVAFVLDQPGQIAAVTFANAPEFAAGGSAGAGATFDGFTTDATLPQAQLVAVDTTATPQVAVGSGSGSLGQRLLRLPQEGLALLRRSPGQAVAFGALLLLAAAAVNGPLRRRRLTQTTAA